jgi:MFS family permease
MNLKRLYYGWVMVIIGFCVLAVNALAIFGFGVFLKPLTAEFGWERGALSSAFSIALLIAGVLSLVSGRLSDRYGPRILVTAAGLSMGIGFLLMSQVSSLWQVYLVWGICVGTAISCSVIPINTTIPRLFIEKRGIAIAIIITGFNLGGIVTPVLIQWLIDAYDWQRSFLILGAIPFIITIPLAQLMKRGGQQIKLNSYIENKPVEENKSTVSAVWGLSVNEAIRTRWFWFFSFMQLSFGFCVQTITVHIVPYATDVEIPAIIAASILSISAGSSIVGNLAIGFFADRIGGRLTLTACLALFTLTFVWLLFTTETWMFYIFAVVFGLARGGIVPLLTVVAAELFGLRHLGSVGGAFLFLSTVGGILGNPIAGLIFDVSGSYSLAFGIDVIIGTLAIILGLILLRYKGRIK